MNETKYGFSNYCESGMVVENYSFVGTFDQWTLFIG